MVGDDVEGFVCRLEWLCTGLKLCHRAENQPADQPVGQFVGDHLSGRGQFLGTGSSLLHSVVGCSRGARWWWVQAHYFGSRISFAACRCLDTESMLYRLGVIDRLRCCHFRFLSLLDNDTYVHAVSTPSVDVL